MDEPDSNDTKSRSSGDSGRCWSAPATTSKLPSDISNCVTPDQFSNCDRSSPTPTTRCVHPDFALHPSRRGVAVRGVRLRGDVHGSVSPGASELVFPVVRPDAALFRARAIRRGSTAPSPRTGHVYVFHWFVLTCLWEVYPSVHTDRDVRHRSSSWRYANVFDSSNRCCLMAPRYCQRRRVQRSNGARTSAFGDDYRGGFHRRRGRRCDNARAVGGTGDRSSSKTDEGTYTIGGEGAAVEDIGAN